MSADAQIEARCHHADDPSAPQCALPGCRHAVPDPGRPCLCCLAAFGNMLHEISPAQDIDGPSQPSGTPPPPTPPAATTTPHRPVIGPLKPNSAVTAILSRCSDDWQDSRIYFDKTAVCLRRLSKLAARGRQRFCASETRKAMTSCDGVTRRSYVRRR
jgi:hypothetical protein